MTRKAEELEPAEQIRLAIANLNDEDLAAKLGPNPRYLNLSDTGVTDAGMVTLVQRGSELRVLNIVGCAKVGAQGFREIAKLPKLVTLRVSGSHLTEEVVEILKSCPALTLIEVTGKASAGGRAVTELRQALRQRRPAAE